MRRSLPLRSLPPGGGGASRRLRARIRAGRSSHPTHTRTCTRTTRSRRSSCPRPLPPTRLDAVPQAPRVLRAHRKSSGALLRWIWRGTSENTRRMSAVEDADCPSLSEAQDLPQSTNVCATRLFLFSKKGLYDRYYGALLIFNSNWGTRRCPCIYFSQYTTPISVSVFERELYFMPS